MNLQKAKLTALIGILLLLPAFYGCPGGTPKITLKVTDCSKDDITITEVSTLRSQAGSQWTFRTKITVKCNGQVVKGAELKVKFWFKDAMKLKTNKDGEINYHKSGQGSKPSGEKFKVTIKGNDGERTEEFTTP